MIYMHLLAFVIFSFLTYSICKKFQLMRKERNKEAEAYANLPGYVISGLSVMYYCYPFVIFSLAVTAVGNFVSFINLII